MGDFDPGSESKGAAISKPANVRLSDVPCETTKQADIPHVPDVPGEPFAGMPNGMPNVDEIHHLCFNINKLADLAWSAFLCSLRAAAARFPVLDELLPLIAWLQEPAAGAGVLPIISMSTNQLPNYLRSCRKSSGLSQQELAFLLDCANGKTVSRYERFSRQPDLERALACEILFGKTVRELFGGVFVEVEKVTRRNVQRLLERLQGVRRDFLTERKIVVLESVLEDPVDVLPWDEQ